MSGADEDCGSEEGQMWLILVHIPTPSPTQWLLYSLVNELDQTKEGMHLLYVLNK
jgi:hypothetical protein